MNAVTGLFPGTSWAAYTAWPGLRYSYLAHFARSPRHAHSAALHPPAPAPAQELGSAIHAAVLEPEAFEKRYCVKPEGIDRRYTAGKAAWAAFEAEAAGREILSQADWDTARAIRDSIYAEPWAHELLSTAGAVELSVRWVDPDSQEPCKARIDRYAQLFDGYPTLIDLKSCVDASRWRFAGDIERYHYGLQAAFYLDGLAAVSPHPRQWIWLAVEKQRPYATALWVADDEIIMAGRAAYRAAIRQHQECERMGYWPGYTETPQVITRPAWARRATAEATSTWEAGF